MGLFRVLIALLPSSSLSSDVSSTLNTFFNQVYAWNVVFPFDTAFTVLGWTVIFWGLVLTWDFAKYILHLIRGN